LDLLKKEKGLIKEEIASKKTSQTEGKDLHLEKKLKDELLANVGDFIKEMEEFLPYTEAEFPIETKQLYDLL